MDDGCDVGGGRDTLPAIKIDGGGSGGQDSLQAVVREHGGGQESLQTVMEIGGGGGDNLPEKITHPFDEKHVLTLLSEPAYGEGRFQCDACSERGKGYSYHCQPCGIDLHVHCAMLPLSVTHGSHVHKLNLTFESPYPEKKFSCDICTSIGSCQWLYTCKSCGFDAHVKCATTEDDASPAHTASKSIEPMKWRQETSVAPITKMGFPEAQVSVNVPRFGVGRQNSGLTTIQQMKINDNRANTTMAQGLMGLVRISNSVIGGDGGYQQSLIGDGNGINFLAGLFEG
ncbi:PREDICTED: uncharacterized protein LOC105969421 [Erythranthe guttata]|uniref:uncharacterized protein LOC105969421 n=1 Tax=Erythranthe guttata TaxID=4155 RepID=UPI00064DCCCF|nr:PREDICTED: uncharacterized protein LOC105969421 [Erythranthe guttata]|eukprot:XP_012849628.1 PREDICTED: uncharacterized protein LOC105969421 [Erythranthe guttata]